MPRFFAFFAKCLASLSVTFRHLPSPLPSPVPSPLTLWISIRYQKSDGSDGKSSHKFYLYARNSPPSACRTEAGSIDYLLSQITSWFSLYCIINDNTKGYWVFALCWGFLQSYVFFTINTTVFCVCVLKKGTLCMVLRKILLPLRPKVAFQL